jgi:hypothetical protein
VGGKRFDTHGKDFTESTIEEQLKLRFLYENFDIYLFFFLHIFFLFPRSQRDLLGKDGTLP